MHWRHKTPIILRGAITGGSCAWTREHNAEPARKWHGRPRGHQFFGRAARLNAMIANRPDWCVSRQRNWGVPIPFFLDKETGEPHPRTPELIEQVAKRVEQGGIEAWFALDPKELLGAEADRYTKMSDTLDVWFDSGTTHSSVMRGSHAEACGYPADLYSKAPTSIAAGSIPVCSPAAPSTAARPTRHC
jgi:isoleucyl-tRNA synthetase